MEKQRDGGLRDGVTDGGMKGWTDGRHVEIWNPEKGSLDTDPDLVFLSRRF